MGTFNGPGFDLKGAFQKVFQMVFRSVSNPLPGRVPPEHAALRGRQERLPREDGGENRMQRSVIKVPELQPAQAMLTRLMIRSSSD